jgi:hypothetical protein
MAVQQHVVQRYQGDRERAMRFALERLGNTLPLGDLAQWSAEQRVTLYLWALPLDLVDGLEQWSLAEKRGLVALIRSKAEAEETKHQLLLARAGRLRAAWTSHAR